MVLSRNTWIGIAIFAALMLVLTVWTVVALPFNANPGGPARANKAAVSRCLTRALSANRGSPEGAAGSIGQVVHFKNHSSATCSLYGYPGMLMLDASGKPLPTDVHRGSSVTVPARPARLVTLASGGEASFDLGYADSTGFGDDRCPTSTRVEITPPNDYKHLTIAWRLQPYGGDIPHLRCGEITVSPVFAGG